MICTSLCLQPKQAGYYLTWTSLVLGFWPYGSKVSRLGLHKFSLTSSGFESGGISVAETTQWWSSELNCFATYCSNFSLRL